MKTLDINTFQNELVAMTMPYLEAGAPPREIGYHGAMAFVTMVERYISATEAKDVVAEIWSAYIEEKALDQ
jgi:hypothetical protein